MKRYFFIFFLIAVSHSGFCRPLLLHHFTDTVYHIDPGFGQNGFVPGNELAAFKKKYAGKLKEIRKIVANDFNEEEKDTVITLYGKGMKFVFYKHKAGAALTEASFSNSVIVLKKGIKTGLTKQEVMKRLSALPAAIIAADVWQTGTEERAQYFEFIFSNNVLKKINYYNQGD